MLSQPVLALIFFVGAHILSLWEFTLLEPQSTTTSNTATNNITSSLPSPVLRGLYCVVSAGIAVLSRDYHNDNDNNNDALWSICICVGVGLLLPWLETIPRRHWIKGTILVTIPFRAWLQLAPKDFASTISLLLVVWNCDTGALLAGRFYRKTGLPRIPVPQWIRKISPAKSMEGFVGGILGGIWTAVSWVPALVYYYGANLETSPTFDALWGPLSHRLGLGLTLSLLAIAGDLVESSVKRQSHSKDSGTLLPGHGGVLDRFDSSLLAVLFYQFLLTKVSVSSQ